MPKIKKIIQDYVKTMRPLGTELFFGLTAWTRAGMPFDDVPDYLQKVHKFSGSAGSTGFLHLSMIATLLEIGLRSAQSQEDLQGIAKEQISLLVSDFEEAVEDLCPEKSSLGLDVQPTIFTPFEEPGHILLTGLPVVVDAILTFVVEQKMAIPLSLPDVELLSTVSENRPPKLVIVSEPVRHYSFPILNYSPMNFEWLIGQWS